MGKFFGSLVLLSLLWGGYWFFGASGVEMGLAKWFEARRSEGWAADYADLNTIGFPNRFDTTITDMRLADPDTGLAWSMPFFQILALSYKPHHVIAVLPHEQTISTPLTRIDVTSDDIRGSLVFRANTALELERTDFVAKGVTLTSTDRGAATFDEMRLAMHREEVAEARYRLGADISGLVPSEELRALLGDLSALPAEIETLHLDATVDFDRPWDRHAIDTARPQPRRIRLTQVQATWGGLDLRFAGDLEIDELGRATGEIAVKATNWREMLELGVSAGAVPERWAATVESGLETLAALSGRSDTLDTTLTLKDGRISLGLIPLGTAPVFRIR